MIPFPTMIPHKHQKKRWTWTKQRSQNRVTRQRPPTVGVKFLLARKKKETKRKTTTNRTHSKKMVTRRTANHLPNRAAAIVGGKTTTRGKAEQAEDPLQSFISEIWHIRQILPICTSSSPCDMAEKVFWSVTFQLNVKVANLEDLDS